VAAPPAQDGPVREQLSALRSMLVLAILLTQQDSQASILHFVANAVESLGSCTTEGIFLDGRWQDIGLLRRRASGLPALTLAAEGNIRVANCSTAAQYFHLLRAQAKAAQAYPLVVMTPKSLLRNRAAYGTIDELAAGEFHEVIDDPRYADGDKSGVERLLLTSGHIYFDLTASPLYEQAKKTAIARVELLSPLPTDQVLRTIASYANAKEVIWVQEEPKNMGARAHVRRRLVERLPHGLEDIDYIGRPYRASPSEGYPGAHAVEQERIVKEALVER